MPGRTSRTRSLINDPPGGSAWPSFLSERQPITDRDNPIPRVPTIVRKPAVKADRVVDIITLDHAARNRRHGALKGEGGTEIHLDLDMETTINDGDALRLEDGSLVQVKAASEKLLEIRAENTARLVRLAWHLGSNHGLVEVTGDAVYIQNDPALAELARGQ